jgi:hypothetical protein
MLKHLRRHMLTRLVMAVLSIGSAVITNHALDKGDKGTVWVFAVMTFCFCFLAVADLFEGDAKYD